MRILVAGASGFIGQALIAYLQQQSHALYVLGRQREKLQRLFPSAAEILDWSSLANSQQLPAVDVIINLAGESIAKLRWTEKEKQHILASRQQANTHLVTAIENSPQPPHTFITVSGIHVYPMTQQNWQESDPLPALDDTAFLMQVGRTAEKISQQLDNTNTRVVQLRLAAVLDEHGGAFPKMRLPYQWGLGAVLGNGQQWFPWIALLDVVRAIAFICAATAISGPVNLIAPEVITQRDFADQLAKQYKRPRWLQIPAPILHGLLGQLADEILLHGCRATPAVLQAQGFQFTYPDLSTWLKTIKT